MEFLPRLEAALECRGGAVWCVAALLSTAPIPPHCGLVVCGFQEVGIDVDACEVTLPLFQCCSKRSLARRATVISEPVRRHGLG